MKWINGLAIKYKILVIGAVGVVGFAVNLIYSFNINSENQERLENIKNADFPVVEHVIDNVNRLDKIKQLLASAFEMGEEDLIVKAEEHAQVVNKNYTDIHDIIEKEVIHSSGYISLLIENVDNVQKKFNAYFDIAKPLTAQLVAGDKSIEDLQPKIQKMNEELKVYENELATFKEMAYEHFVNTIYEAKHASDMATQLALSIGVVVVLLLGLVSFVMNKIIRSSIANVAKSLHDIARGDGDLTQRLVTPSKDEIGDLVKNFNHFVEKLQKIIREVSASTAQLSGASHELSSSAASTNIITNEQQAQIDHIASAVHEMTISIQNVAGNASNAASSAKDANENVVEGQKVVAENIRSIDALANEIEEAAKVTEKLKSDSESISVVMSVIKSIAEQTNLLALNAAIESARAGEQGRGFAVVADEVRTLASRTQESTKEIEAIVNTLQTNAVEVVSVMQRSQEKAVESVAGAEKAGGSFDSIASAVKFINDMSTQIASAVDQQSNVAEQVNKNVIKVKDSAVRAANEANQAAVFSDKLSALSTSLEKLVGNFKV